MADFVNRNLACLLLKSQNIRAEPRMGSSHALPKLRVVKIPKKSYTWDGTQAELVDPYGALGRKLHAGDRAPQAPGLVDVETGKATSVFEILSSSWHTAFVFADSIDEADPTLDPLRTSHPGAFRGAEVNDLSVLTLWEEFLLNTSDSTPGDLLVPRIKIGLVLSMHRGPSADVAVIDGRVDTTFLRQSKW